MPDDLDARLRAVERALVDGDPPESLAAAGELTTRIETVEERLADLEERTLALEAATRALSGYVGNVRHVNRAVERRAEAALAAVDRLEPDGTTRARATPTQAAADGYTDTDGLLPPRGRTGYGDDS